MVSNRFTPHTLRLNTLENSRKTLARLMRLHASGKVERDMFKDLVYGCSVLLSFFKAELDQDFAERLEHVEEMLEGQNVTASSYAKD